MKRSSHGLPLRGLSESHPTSPSFEGTFGRMFRTLPPAKFSPEALQKLSLAMTAPHDPETPEDEIDDEENPGIDAGYTYFGQFIDHDLTFDPASSMQKQNDPNGIVDFRTPKFDMDNLYGRGPDDQPYMYDGDGIHFLLGPALTGNNKDNSSRGLQRNTPPDGQPKRAIIGDPRNDENVIVSQIQANMLRFHNKLADMMIAKKESASFSDIQQMVRWHYQWVIVHDFLPTIVGQDMVDSILPHIPSGETTPDLRIYNYRQDPYMPVEFSVAAYRFGHSMVRPIYRLNQTLPQRQVIFDKDPNKSLNGFREFPNTWAIDFDLFFNPGDAPLLGTNRIQKAYKIDTSLVNPLGHLAPAHITTGISSLAHRNLLRGLAFGLPSGQAVARQMGENVIPDEKLRVGKANEDGENPGKDGIIANKLLTDISPEFKDNAPLWYYVLAEAQQQFVNNSTPLHLGPVGGRIVAEVFIGLLYADPHSYVNQHRNWEPMKEFRDKDGDFGIKDLLRAARS